MQHVIDIIIYNIYNMEVEERKKDYSLKLKKYEYV